MCLQEDTHFVANGKKVRRTRRYIWTEKATEDGARRNVSEILAVLSQVPSTRLWWQLHYERVARARTHIHSIANAQAHLHLLPHLKIRIYSCCQTDLIFATMAFASGRYETCATFKLSRCLCCHKITFGLQWSILFRRDTEHRVEGRLFPNKNGGNLSNKFSSDVGSPVSKWQIWAQIDNDRMFSSLHMRCVET